jgi:hypothetical protein
MQSSDIDPAALGFTVIVLNIALEEALKALAEKNGNRAGPWLDEVQELALLRGRGTADRRTRSRRRLDCSRSCRRNFRAHAIGVFCVSGAFADSA